MTRTHRRCAVTWCRAEVTRRHCVAILSAQWSWFSCLGYFLYILMGLKCVVDRNEAWITHPNKCDLDQNSDQGIR